MNGYGPVPVLGPHQEVKSPLPMFVGLARTVDDQGLVVCEHAVMGQNGETVGIIGRDSYLDATELLDSIRLIIREEVARAFRKEG